MPWKIVYSDAAGKQFDKLDKAVQRSIKKYLLEFSELENPAARGHPLIGPLAGLHRYRVGQLRIIVMIERHTITVIVTKIDRRDSVY